MKTDIILAGVGGQGILSIAAVIGEAAIASGLNIKQAEVHGMSQRGGAVHSNLRLSDLPIASDLIPQGKATLILSLEPMEALRYMPWLATTGWLVTNTTPFVNISNYPDIKEILSAIDNLPQKVALDVDEIAKSTGSAKAANMVLLGAATPFIDIPYQRFADSIVKIFTRKGQAVVDVNIAALEAGKAIAEKVLKG